MSKMPWCPECKTEYRPEFDTCADCKIPLADEKPVFVPSRWEKWTASPMASVLSTAGLYLGLLLSIFVVLPLVLFLAQVSRTEGEQLNVSVALFSLCTFGFARGSGGFEQAAAGIALSMLILAGCFLRSFDSVDISVFASAFVLAAPPIISAYLGSQWKSKGNQYLFIWIASTVILTSMPYAIKMVWP